MIRNSIIGVLIFGLIGVIYLLAANSGCTNSALLNSVCSEDTKNGFEQAKMLMGSWVVLILAFMTSDFFNMWDKK